MSYTISPNATTVTNTTNAGTAGSSSSSSNLTNDAATVTSNYNTFLNLLPAQIQNQDPLSPMDTTAWTTQLVQYSQVEQQLQGNQYLSQIASNSGANMSSAVDYIGKTVTASSDTATLANGSASWNYNLAGATANTTLTVKDSNGNTVYQTAGDTAAGNHGFTWNGTEANGNTATTGDYTLSITSTDASGNGVSNTVGITGVVSSAQQSNGTVTLTVGNTQVPLSDVTGVSDTAAASN
jgi:flagellar basal-body rod modification protein FlgD